MHNCQFNSSFVPQTNKYNCSTIRVHTCVQKLLYSATVLCICKLILVVNTCIRCSTYITVVRAVLHNNLPTVYTAKNISLSSFSLRRETSITYNHCASKHVQPVGGVLLTTIKCFVEDVHMIFLFLWFVGKCVYFSVVYNAHTNLWNVEHYDSYSSTLKGQYTVVNMKYISLCSQIQNKAGNDKLKIQKKNRLQADNVTNGLFISLN